MTNIKYQKLSEQDIDYLTGLLRLYEDVFEIQNYSMPDRKYLYSLLKNDNMIFYVAILEGDVVGGLTAHFLPSTSFPASEVYIYDLAVKTELQRKGIGRQLLGSLKDFCRDRNVKEIFVQADLEDQHAVDFYHSTGGIPEKVIHFSYNLTR